MRKRSCFAIFIVSVALLGLISVPVMAADVSDNVSVSGLAVFAAGCTKIDYTNGTDVTKSDLALSNVEVAFDAKVNEWVNVHALLYYERPVFDAAAASGPVWDEGIVTIGNTEKSPFFLAAGLMYAPFGVLQTHFPGDPTIKGPLTLELAEAQKEAVAIGLVHEGLTATVYGFRGHWDANTDTSNHKDSDLGSYGADVKYKLAINEGSELLVGASYLSNVAESDSVVNALKGTYNTLKEDADACAVYLNADVADFFFAAEYITALDGIAEVPTEGATGAKPAAWNVEAGYNMVVADKNLEIAVQYAGSDESDAIGIPEERYGVCANLGLFDDTVVSLAYLNDDYYRTDTIDTADTVVAQVAVEF